MCRSNSYRLSITLPIDTKEKIHEQATLQGISMSELGCNFIQTGLEGKPRVEEVSDEQMDFLCARVEQMMDSLNKLIRQFAILRDAVINGNGDDQAHEPQE